MCFFSVVIPLYNKEKFFARTLQSVVDQNYSNFEVIVVDDGSTDSSPTIIKGFDDSRIKLLHQINSGVSSARNNGILNSKGKFVVFLDADDYWCSNHLSTLYKMIHNFQNHSIFCTNYKLSFSHNASKLARFSNVSLKGKKTFEVDNFFKLNLLNSIICTPTSCIKRELLLQYKMYDTKLLTSEDTDLWIRLTTENKILFINTYTVVVNRRSENSLSKKLNPDIKIKFLQKHSNISNADTYSKIFMDKIRYTVYLEYRLLGKNEQANLILNKINYSNLNWKQKLVILCNVTVLRTLFKIKNKLNYFGIWLKFH